MNVISYEEIKFVLIHGLFDKSAGDNNVSKLIPIIYKYFPNAIIDQDSADYGWMGVLKASWFWWLTDIIPRISKTLFDDTDVVISHSNGANFCMKALAKVSCPDIKVFHLSPALNRKHKFTEEFKSCDVLYTSGDSAVLAAMFLSASALGGMGRYVPSTKDERVFSTNFRSSGIKYHSDWFLNWHHETFFKVIRNRINQGN